MKKGIIISGNLAQDHEFIYPYYRLLEENVQLDVCLLEGKPVVGILGTALPPNKEQEVKKIEDVKVADYDEALSVANDTDFGLVSGIVTKSLSRANHFRRNAESGCVMVNLPTAGTDYHVPFGGRKNSSFGPREQGSYAKELYTQVKTSYISGGNP